MLALSLSFFLSRFASRLLKLAFSRSFALCCCLLSLSFAFVLCVCISVRVSYLHLNVLFSSVNVFFFGCDQQRLELKRIMQSLQ